MELCVHDKVTADPTAEDVRRAIEAVPHPEDWYLTLEADDGTYIEAAAKPDGTYRVSAADGDDDLKAKTSLDAAKLKSLLLKYLARDGSWRDVCRWTKIDREHTAPPVRSEPPPWAIGIVVGSIALVVLTSMFLQGSDNSWRDALPFANSDYFWVGLIALPFVTLLVVAVLAKMIEVRQASTWATAMGRVVKSETEAQRHRSGGDATTVKTVPIVEYEFSVGGHTWRGNRISIGEDAGGENTEATLRRYPVGAVVSVHYDPGNPKKSVLERGIPDGVRKGMIVLLAFGAIVAVIGYWLVTRAPRLIEEHLPAARTDAPVVIFVACMGVLVLLFFVASWRVSRRAADWPRVRGIILSSGSEKVEKSSKGRSRTLYVPAVEYGYRVNDVDYVSRQIRPGVVVFANEDYAKKIAARYSPGSSIDVRYDSTNPANAALENSGGLHWLLLAVALGCFAIAAYAAGVLP